jgi:hypothetical protein
MKYKSILILYQPGAGGVHLANLISTSPHVENRLKNPTDSLLEKYQSQTQKNAHFDVKIINVGIDNLDHLYYTVKSSDLTYVLCGHIEESYYAVNKIKDLGEVFYIILENVNLSDSVLKRLYHCEGTNFLYRDDLVQKLFNASPDQILATTPNLLFCRDISPLIEMLNCRLNLRLDIDFCQKLHDFWLRNIKF